MGRVTERLSNYDLIVQLVLIIELGPWTWLSCVNPVNRIVCIIKAALVTV